MQDLKKLSKIGEGRFSEVFLVETPQRAKFVLKQYKSGFGREARREYLYLNTFSDEGIVKAVQFFEEENPALLLEHVSGKVLHYSLFSNRKQIFSFLAGLAETISKIHAAGICLNDLKPENIIVRKNKPVILDFGLATLNLYNDGFLRGTLAYAAPEKFLHQTNHFPADVFSLGIIFLFLTTGKTPADNFSLSEYKELLANREKWENYISKLPVPEFIKQMLNFSALKRPTALVCANYFAEHGALKLKDLTNLEIKNIVFQNQIKAAEKLLKVGYLKCNSFDEPKIIINLLSLLSESQNRQLIILKERDFIWSPQIFFKSLSSALRTEVKTASELKKVINKKADINILLIREEPYSDFFDDFPKTKNVLILKKEEESEIANISKRELKEILANIHLKNSEKLLKNYRSSRPYFIRLLLLNLISETNRNTASERDNELTVFVSQAGIPIPFVLVEKLWNNWKQLLQDAIYHHQLILEGEALRVVGKSAGNCSAKFLKKAAQTAAELKLFFVAARIFQLLRDDKSALEFYRYHIMSLISAEYYFSAFETYRTLHRDFSEQKIPFDLQKKEAFLSRICGFPRKALQIYKRLEKNLNGLEQAVISADKAIVLQELGEYEQAIKLYEKAATTFVAEGKIKDSLRTKNNLGVVLVAQNRFREAENTFRDLLKTAETYNDIQFVTMANLNLADVFLKTGEWKKSLHFARCASEIAEKHKKFEIQIYAELYAIQANFALGNSAEFPKIIRRMQDDKKIKENKKLYNYLQTVFLFITEFIEESAATKIAAELENANIDVDDETKLTLFFHFYRRNQIFKTLEIFRKIDDKKFARAVLESDSEKIKTLLNNFTVSGNVYRYLYFASQILLSGKFSDAKNLLENIRGFLKIYSFAPLESLLTKRNNVPHQLPVYWEILNRIHGSVEFSKTMQAVLSGILKIGKLERAIYFYYQHGDIQPVIGLDSELAEIDTENIMVSRTILHDTIKMGKLRFLTNLQEDIPFDIHSSIFGLGLRTALCFPLIINGETKGIIYSDARGDKVFSEEEKKVLELILIQARSALEKSDIFENLKRETETIKSNVSGEFFRDIIGSSRRMQEIFSLMKTVGEHNVNVLITGPTGSGKELIARALHDEYAKNSPFVVVNCAAIPEQLLESELFGYKKGAFTGAVNDRKGKIEMANEGTLFLDEIGDMPLSLQAKLLRVIQERVVTPIGSSREIRVSIRLIAATNQDLEKMVENKLFREDLYYRLKVINIKLPPLSERKEDIPQLVYHFIRKFNKKFDKNINGISSEALNFLRNKEWKGNVRELENEIEKAVLLCNDTILSLEYLKDADNRDSFSLFDNIPEKWKEYQNYKNRIATTLDANYIKRLLKTANGNIRKASKLAGISRTQIYRLLNKEK